MSARSIRRNSERAERTAARRLSRRAKIATGATIVAGSAVLAPTAGAATFTVDNLNDAGSGSLRDAISSADSNPGADTINFAPTVNGEIRLATNLSIGSPDGLTINGPGVSVVSISGDTNNDDTNNTGDVDVIEVGPSARLSLSNLTLREGFSSNPKYGGAITALPESTVTVANSRIADSYGVLGGGVRNYAADVTIAGTTITGNSGDFFGGGVSAQGTKYQNPDPSLPEAKTTITGSTITGNDAGYIGGGLVSIGTKYDPADNTDPNPAGSDLTITDTTISGNSATASGGAFVKYSESTVTNSRFDANSSQGIGGLALLGGDATVKNSTMSGNQVQFGGGLVTAKYARADISNSVISGNSAASEVAGVATYAGTGPGGTKYATPPNGDVEIADSTISGNESAGASGGISIANIPAGNGVKLLRSTVSGNSAAAADTGGGVYVGGENQGDISIVDSTVAGNSAGYGAGVFLVSVGSTPASVPPKILNSTIAGNTAAQSGGGLFLSSYNSDSSNPSSPTKTQTVPLSSTIVADNAAAGVGNDLGADAADQPGGFVLGSSLVEAPGTAPVSQSPAGSSILGTDPQLGPLADNGGPTKTLLPAEGSPVRDKGVANGLTTDQRGLSRTNGPGTDIGSVEIQDTTAPTVTLGKKPKKKIKTRKKKVKAKLAFTASETGSTFECKVDKKAFKPCTSPLKVKVKSKPRKGKKHTIAVRATDNAGNTGPEAKVKFKVIRKG